MSRKLEVVLMCGLPGCGKSTYTKNLLKTHVIVSPDNIRKDIFGHQFCKTAEPFVWAFAKGMAELLLNQGKSIVIDATNLHIGFRKEWYSMARRYKANIKIIWLKTPLNVCIKRRKGIVDEDIVRSMAAIFSNPTTDCLDYGAKLVSVPNKLGKNEDKFNIYSKSLYKKVK